MKRSKGFSLIELIIVIAILSIVLSIASYSWQRFTANSNLRSAARQVASDISKYHALAIAEGRTYTITFNTAESYNIAAPAYDNYTALNLNLTPVEEAKAENRQITAGPVFTMTPRGLNNAGTVLLTNSRGATARISLNNRGKVDVSFTGL